MPLSTLETLIMFSIIALTTLLTRALPFFIFPENKKTPKFVDYLGKVLPLTIAGLLVVYSLKDASFQSSNHAIPESIAIIGIILVHLWKKNTLISIGLGTGIYMLLIRLM